MGSEYKSYSIGETCHVTDGAHSKVARQDDGVLYLTSKNLKVGTLSLDKVDYISEEDFDRLFPIDSKAKRRPIDGDILIGIIGTFGNAYRYKASDHFGVSSSVAIIRPDKEKLNSDYFYYVVTSQTFKAIHSAYKSGSVQGYTNIPTIKTLPLPVPPLPEQKAIAHILGSLDDKIELNRQMNETLESMAQALFKSWFVDFDPVIDNALAAGNPIPDVFAERAEQRKELKSGKVSFQGSENNHQSLFPSEFEFTDEMGWIPKGWGVEDSGQLFDVRDGTHDSPKKAETGKYLITSRHITSGVIDFSNAYLISEEDYIEVNRRSKVDSYDILLTMIGTVGESLIVLQDDINFAIKNVGLFKTGKSKEFAIFFYLYLNTAYMKQFLESRLAGTTQKYLTLKVLRTLPVISPNENLLKFFVELMTPSFKKIHSNNQEVENLSKLRDTLLPKLLSGELRIPDAEKLIEEAKV